MYDLAQGNVNIVLFDLNTFQCFAPLLHSDICVFFCRQDEFRSFMPKSSTSQKSDLSNFGINSDSKFRFLLLSSPTWQNCLFGNLLVRPCAVSVIFVDLSTSQVAHLFLPSYLHLKDPPRVSSSVLFLFQFHLFLVVFFFLHVSVQLFGAEFFSEFKFDLEPESARVRILPLPINKNAIVASYFRFRFREKCDVAVNQSRSSIILTAIIRDSIVHDYP